MNTRLHVGVPCQQWGAIRFWRGSLYSDCLRNALSPLGPSILWVWNRLRGSMGHSLGADIWDMALLALIEGTQRSGGHARGQSLPSDPCFREFKPFPILSTCQLCREI